MAYTFAKAQGGSIGKSLCENDKLDYALEMIEKAKKNGVALLLPTDTVFAHLPEYQVGEAAVARLMNGAPTYRCQKPDGLWRVYGMDGAFLGLARTEGGTLKVEKLFVERG